MRPLPPTIREKKRYILIRITGCSPEQKDIYRAVADSVADIFGDVGAAKMHPVVVWSENGYAVVRCTRGFEKSVRAAISCVSKCGGVSANFRPVNTSGSIRGAKQKMGDPNKTGKKIDDPSNEKGHRYLTTDDII